MSPLRSILVLADFSPKSDNAVARAALLAREHGAALRLLHVVPARRFAAVSRWAPERDDLPVRLERAHRELATLAAQTAKAHGVAAACIVRAGDALQVTIDEARGADLVVVAAKRSNPLRDFVLKTPVERLLRILQRPMLVVKRPASGAYTEMLVSRACSLQGGVLAEPTLRRASAAGNELVVVAKDGAASRAKFLLGTLAQRLLAQASCDVLVLPKADGETTGANGALVARRRAVETAEQVEQVEQAEPTSVM